MSGIPSELVVPLRNALEKCEQFYSDRNLFDLFVDDRISLWKNSLRQTDTLTSRVDATIYFLHDKYRQDGSNALVLMLHVLIDRFSGEDERVGLLMNLAIEIEEVFGSKSKPISQTYQTHSASLKQNSLTDQDISDNIASPSASIRRDFFISYNRKDKQWAEWIAWHLEAANYTTFIQAWDFKAGSNFVADMQMAATNAERTIAVLSKHYLHSRFVQPEWHAAFAQDPTGEKGLLIPVRVRECEPQGLLPQIVYIDLVDLPGEVAKSTLLTGVKRDRKKPTIAPEYPNNSE